jgi:polyvinyl alcohol dehydrogenase (cytochrome)
MSGQSIYNWRNQPNETSISTSNVGTLHSVWQKAMPGDVSATPTVSNGVVYVPDWGGKFTALDARNGTVIWQDDLGTLLGKAAGSVASRTGPAISGNTVYISTQQGGLLLSINATNGALNWSTPIDVYGNQYATGTQSPVVFQGVVYAGVSSSEEGAVAFGAQCCTFRGNFSAFSANSGKRIWSFTTIGDTSWAAGYRGVGVWGSTPVIDQARGYVYITTGNDYTAPQSVQDCQNAWQPGTPYTCEDQYPDNHVDSVVALNRSTGAMVWSRRLQLYDAWNVACIFGTSQCPTAVGPDYDFGQGAMLVKNTKVGDVLVAGQKSGWLWGLNPADGTIRWSNQAGPGGTLGGLEWGSSTDGNRVYYAVSNSDGTPFTLTNPAPGSASSTSAGLWGAVDVATGKTIWQQADPAGYMDVGAVSNANGVVYASSFGPQNNGTSGHGTMVALNAATGAILSQFAAVGSVNSGAAIANGTVYWGSGYANLGLGYPGKTLYALQP